MTRKLFWEDPYQKEFDATIEKIDENKIVLDKTAFYPRGGGLVSDVGNIDEVEVSEVVKGENNEIVHIMEDGNFQVGQQVHGKIDWEKRYDIKS